MHITWLYKTAVYHTILDTNHKEHCNEHMSSWLIIYFLVNKQLLKIKYVSSFQCVFCCLGRYSVWIMHKYNSIHNRGFPEITQLNATKLTMQWYQVYASILMCWIYFKYTRNIFIEKVYSKMFKDFLFMKISRIFSFNYWINNNKNISLFHIRLFVKNYLYNWKWISNS